MGRGQELLDAAREGDRKIVEKIIGQITKRSGPFTSLRRGAGVNVQDDNGYTPLHHACLRGHREIVRLLLSVDASPAVVDKKGATPLHLAAWKGDADVVSTLLSHSNPPVNIDQLTSEQETALLIAAQFGNVDVVAALLARGADVTARNVKDESALDLAAQYGRLETVQHLLRARPQLVDPYRFPVSRGRLFAATPLHRASKNGHKEVVSTLIMAGVDANVRTHAGTALHEAANYGKASVVRVLLSKGADLNAADRRGKTVHDILNEYSEEATKRVRRIIREHMATNGYDSEEELPPFPVQDYSPTGYANAGPLKPPETQKNFSLSLSSSSSSIPNKSHQQGFVQKLAKKYLGFKAKFNSAPNISNTSSIEPEISVRPKNHNPRDSAKSIQIGNSKFFKLLSKKEDAGEIVCNDEFDTISLDRLGSLDRGTTVNRSNRSCPGFKTSLPHIAEHTELTDSDGSLSDSVLIREGENDNNNKADGYKVLNEAVNINPKLSIFEPRKEEDNTRISNTSSDSANMVNECYESYEFVKSKIDNLNKVDLLPKPSPRPTIEARKNSTEGIIYENIAIESKIVPPKPAERTTVSPMLPERENKVVYEIMTPRSDVRRKAPEPPIRTKLPDNNKNSDVNDSGSSSDLSSNSSSESMSDEANFEDILLSKKSTSFKHRTKMTVHKNSIKSDLNKSQSFNSLSSDMTEASAMENVDCSAELDEKSMYLSMTGTLPSKKPERAVKKKVLFRHKTFTNIEVDRNSINHFPKSSATETLANYHIRGTGHCIYKAPTVEEFIYVFNRNTLYKDVAPFNKVDTKRDSYFETAICFCKPVQPKFHKSAEDLLEVAAISEDNVTIDLDALKNYNEMQSTSFKCFCDSSSCTFHTDKRGSENNLIVRFSAIKKSISTPNITLESSPQPIPRKPNLSKNKSVPSILEEPYAVVDILKISANNDKEVQTPTSNQSTASREYSLKDIADEISVNSGSTLQSVASNYLRQSSSSSGQWSLHTCNSNATVKSEQSFKSCIEEDSSDDGTLHSDDAVSDSDTIKSETSAKKPWVHSDSFRFDGKDSTETSGVESASPLDASLESGSRIGLVRSGSGRRRWDDAEGTSEGDALSLSSAASSCAPHLAHHQEYSKISPTPPKKPPRRNLSVSPTHANSPSSGCSYELRPHARSQDDLDDIQGSKNYLKHGRSVDQYVDGKLSYSEYDESPRLPNPPVPKPRPSLMNRTQPVAITAMYENVVIKQQNPKRKLRRNLTPQSENEPARQKSLESLLDSSMSASDCERYCEGARVVIPLSPTHYDQPPTPEHPPPSARHAENSIHERIRPLSQEYKRWSAHRDSDSCLPRAPSAVSLASAATDRSGDAVVEYVCDVPFAGLFKGSTTNLEGCAPRPAPPERPKTLRKLRPAYDAPAANGDEVRSGGGGDRGDRSLSILSPFDEQEEWAKISEIMASFGSKLGRESLFVSEFEHEFSRLGLSCSESSLSSSATLSVGHWLASLGVDYETLFQEHGYDDVDFVNGVLDESDLRQMGIDEADRQRILQTSKQLPKKIAEISNNNNNNVGAQTQRVDEWLKSIHLEQYSDAFRKHLYSDMERVRRIWEVELTAVLEIHKIGHRKRILASVANEHNSPLIMEDINEDLNCMKTNFQHLKDDLKEKIPLSEHLKPVPPPTVPSLAPPAGETLKRSKKNRPAPQPPKPSDLEIRAPSELLVGFPGALKTQWKHQPFVLVTGAVTYVANYLGSTVVKELRGTESTKKSIQKLKKSAKEPRDSPDIILSITYRGVKFLNTITRELICEHEIRNIHCACQDADDLTHFAYITKDHGTRSHYCHVFCVATMDQATEVILTLGEAFEVAYQMALREQSHRRAQTRTLHDPHKTPQDPNRTPQDPNRTPQERPPNHGRSQSITEIKLNGHQLKIAPMPTSLSNENFQDKDVSKTTAGLLKAPIASTEEL